MSTTVPSDALIDSFPVPLIAEWDEHLRGLDPLGFPGYDADMSDHSGEAIRTGLGFVRGTACAVVESHYDVFGGSMGLAVGERVSRAFRRAAAEQLPVVASVRTGGARMQEGMLSLIQMPRVVSAIDEHAASGQISVGLLRSPTTGGVFASWASLLDVRAAESGATIGFAGPRVVAEMTGTMPPPTSHNAESAYAAGLVDAVVGPDDVLSWLYGALGAGENALALPGSRADLFDEFTRSHNRAHSPMHRVRERSRPSGLEWAARLCEDWTEIKGSDPTVRAGLATVGGVRCIVVVMDRHAHGDGRGRQTPDGYRLAQRAVELAARLHLPVLTLVDTPGADPTPDSEADGIAREIARTLRSLDRLPTPSVSVCVGVCR